MKIVKNLEVPTGNILIVEGEKGLLECVSLGDYGKDQNIKADFLGLTREIKKIEHTQLMPLSEKWVVTISSQYGCSMSCQFCDVPKVGKGVNCTEDDLINQIETAMSIHPEIKSSKRLNIHYARMGEPTFNDNIISASEEVIDRYENSFHIHPVISTMLPKTNKNLSSYIFAWLELKNLVLCGEAGLQYSINSTDEEERNRIFNRNSLPLEEIAKLPTNSIKPEGRKYTLNFAIADFKIDASIIAKYFNPEHFMIKLTPMHKTITAENNDIRTIGDYTTIYPYLEIENEFKKYGFDVLVFLASVSEDMGRITCGNAILSGSEPGTKWRYVHI